MKRAKTPKRKEPADSRQQTADSRQQTVKKKNKTLATETDFHIDWLNERYSFDCKARNQEVEQACLAHFQQKQRIHIVDIGAGTGSNFLYLADRFKQNQIWTLVELNPLLLEAAKKSCIDYASANNYQGEDFSTRLELKKADHTITIHFKQSSFLELEEAVSLETIDLVTAGAVFDLLNPAMFKKMARLLLDQKVALLATINYQGMNFQPEEISDQSFIKYFEAHMVRPQEFGQAMGPSCTPQMLAYYQDQGITIISGSSNWMIKDTDRKMSSFLFNYLEEGIGAMLSSNNEQDALNTWINQKKKQTFQWIVEHQDIFVPT